MRYLLENKIYLCCRIYSTEPLREQQEPYRKPIGASAILLNDNIWLYTENYIFNNMKVYVSSNNSDCNEGIQQLVENIINNQSDKIKLSNDFTPLQISCCLMSGYIDDVCSKDDILISPLDSDSVNRRDFSIDFPKVVLLCFEQFKLGELNMKSKNFILHVYVCNTKGELIGSISRGKNTSTPSNNQKNNPITTSYYYHNNNPTYNEYFSLQLPSTTSTNDDVLYCIIKVEHISSNAGRDTQQCTSFFKITTKSEYSKSSIPVIVKDEKKELVCYKTIEKNKNETLNQYLNRILYTYQQPEYKNKCKDKLYVNTKLISPNHSTIENLQWFLNVDVSTLIQQNSSAYCDSISHLVVNDVNEIIQCNHLIFTKLFELISKDSILRDVSIQTFLELLYCVKQTRDKEFVSTVLSHFISKLPDVTIPILHYYLNQYNKLTESEDEPSNQFLSIINEITDVLMDVVQFIYDGYEKLNKTVTDDIKDNITSIIIYYVNFIQSLHSRPWIYTMITTLNINIMTIFDLIDFKLENDNILITLFQNLLLIFSESTSIKKLNLELKLSIILLIYDLVDSTIFSDSPLELRMKILESIINIYTYYKEDNNRIIFLLSLYVLLAILEFCQVKCPTDKRPILLPLIDYLLLSYDNRNAIQTTDTRLDEVKILSLKFKLIPLVKKFYFIGDLTTGFLFYFYLIDEKSFITYINTSYKEDEVQLSIYDKIIKLSDTLLINECYKSYWNTLIKFKLQVLAHIPIILASQLFNNTNTLVQYCKSIHNLDFLSSFVHLSLNVLIKGYECDPNNRYLVILPQYILQAWNDIESPRCEKIPELYNILLLVIPIKPNLKIFDMVKELFYSIIEEEKENFDEFIVRLFIALRQYLQNHANYNDQETTCENEIYSLYDRCNHLLYFFTSLLYFLRNKNKVFYNNDNKVIKFLSCINDLITYSTIILHPTMKRLVQYEFMCSTSYYGYMKLLLKFGMCEDFLTSCSELSQCQTVWKTEIEKCATKSFAFINSPDTTMNKHQLLTDCLSLCESTKVYEVGIKTLDYIEPYYKSTYQYTELSDCLKHKSEYYLKIISEDRTLSNVFPNYYYVGFFGENWVQFYKNKDYIAKANNFEKLDTFSQRIKNQFPDSELDLSQKPLTKEQLNDLKNKRVIKTFILSVATKGEIDNNGIIPIDNRTTPNKIRQYSKNNDTKYFCSSYAVKKHEGKSNNEFLEKWIIKIYYECEDVFPFPIRFSPIVKTKTITLNPIEGAIDALHSKINDINDAILDSAAIKVVSQNFTQMLGGVIDAAVNGGLANYYPIINGEYKTTYPEIAESLNENADKIIGDLREALNQLILALEHAMSVHQLKCDVQMRPFHEHLMAKFVQMKKALGELLDQEKSL